MNGLWKRLRGKKDPREQWIQCAQAISTGCDVRTLEKLLEGGVDLNSILDQEAASRDPFHPWEIGYTLVHFAAAHNTACIRVLAQRGAIIDLPTVGGGPLYQGRTPLYVAARNGSVPSVTALLDLGASPRTARGDGWTIVHAAAGNGHTGCLQLILDAGNNKDVNIEYRKGRDLYHWTPLLRATGQGHVPCIRLLLERGADPDIIRSDGVSALHWAAQQGHHEAISVLLPAMKNPMPTLKNGYTPLHEAARFGHVESVRVLLDFYTPEQALYRDRHYRTAFHCALLAHGNAALNLSMPSPDPSRALRFAAGLVRVCALLHERYPRQPLPHEALHTALASAAVVDGGTHSVDTAAVNTSGYETGGDGTSSATSTTGPSHRSSLPVGSPDDHDTQPPLPLVFHETKESTDFDDSVNRVSRAPSLNTTATTTATTTTTTTTGTATATGTEKDKDTHGSRSHAPPLAPDPLPTALLCPLSHVPLLHAVLASDGHSYDHDAIVQYLGQDTSKRLISPVTGLSMPNTAVTPNQALRDQVREYMAAHSAPASTLSTSAAAAADAADADADADDAGRDSDGSEIMSVRPGQGFGMGDDLQYQPETDSIVASK